MCLILGTLNFQEVAAKHWQVATLDVFPILFQFLNMACEGR